MRFRIRRGRKRKRPPPTSRRWIEKQEESAMPRYVRRPGHPLADEMNMVDASLLDPEDVRSAPYVISDTMAPLQHMATGRFHDSKAAFRRDTKLSGCVEYGNETAALLKPRKQIPMDRGKRREDIRKALYEARNR